MKKLLGTLFVLEDKKEDKVEHQVKQDPFKQFAQQ